MARADQAEATRLMDDPRWHLIAESPDNDGHGIRWYQHATNPWLMIELYPCPDCASSCRYVIERTNALCFHQVLSILTSPVFSLS